MPDHTPIAGLERTGWNNHANAMAMKLLALLGGGGMFVEFFAMDFEWKNLNQSFN